MINLENRAINLNLYYTLLICAFNLFSKHCSCVHAVIHVYIDNHFVFSEKGCYVHVI